MPVLRDARVAKKAGEAHRGLRVLFPLDGSEQGYAGLDRALELLPASSIHATLLVVLQDFRGAPEDMVGMFEDDVDDEVFPTEDSGLLVLRQATKRLREKGVKMTLKLAKGKIAREILAEAGNHDLLVMHRGTHHRFFGGAMGLARKAPCSVLLVKG